MDAYKFFVFVRTADFYSHCYFGKAKGGMLLEPTDKGYTYRFQLEEDVIGFLKESHKHRQKH